VRQPPLFSSEYLEALTSVMILPGSCLAVLTFLEIQLIFDSVINLLPFIVVLNVKWWLGQPAKLSNLIHLPMECTNIEVNVLNLVSSIRVPIHFV